MIGLCDGTCDRVTIDDNESGTLLARHLIERGHKKFGNLSSRGVPQSQNLKPRGFIEAVQGFGEVVWDASASRYDQDLGEALSKAARTLGFSALFCSNYILAITCINELSNAGISIRTNFQLLDSMISTGERSCAHASPQCPNHMK